MKPTLDDLRRSAEFCGYGVRVANDYDGSKHILYGKSKSAAITMEITTLDVWNPPENAAQDRECYLALAKRGFTWLVMPDLNEYWLNTDRDNSMEIHCDRLEDFATLAASKLQQERGEG